MTIAEGFILWGVIAAAIYALIHVLAWLTGGLK